MLFSTTLFPYTTGFVDAHFDSLVAQLVYGAVFLAVTLCNFGLHYALVRADPTNQPLRYAALRHAKMSLDMAIKLAGVLLGVLG